jgi:hypothetical protein
MGEQNAVAQRAAQMPAELLPAVQDAERQLAVPPAAVQQPAARVSALKLAEGARHVAPRRAEPAPDVRVLPAARALQGARPVVLRRLLLPVLLRRRPYAVARRPSSPSPRKR